MTGQNREESALVELRRAEQTLLAASALVDLGMGNDAAPANSTRRASSSSIASPRPVSLSSSRSAARSSRASSPTAARHAVSAEAKIRSRSFVVPDLAGWRREKMPDAIGPDDAPPYYDVRPDWICEVLSAHTERLARGKKMRIYRRELVGHVWLVSPVHQTLEVYRLEPGRWVMLETFVGDDACAPSRSTRSS